jgi:hypothetical protein
MSPMIQVRVEQVLLVVRVPRVYFDVRYLAHSIPHQMGDHFSMIVSTGIGITGFRNARI